VKTKLRGENLRSFSKSTLIGVFLLIIIVVALFVGYIETRPRGNGNLQPSALPTVTPTLTLSPTFTTTPPPSNIPTGTTLSPTPTVSATATATVSPSQTPVASTAPPSSPTSSPTPTSTPTALYPGEVRDYQGAPLSSIADVYENAIAGTQYINQSTYRLTINGLVNNTLQLSYNLVLDYPHYVKPVTIYCVEGWSTYILWEGVLVGDLIEAAEPSADANTVIFYASDGYSTALPLDYVVNNNILLAYKMNNVTLPPERGFPFQLVAESQYGYKWIKWVTTIELSNDPNYLGYWESRGFPNNATIP
jgi:DMSO/TMAO reductase YedYZ molybdopterin-dependent catalytic subunit